MTGKENLTYSCRDLGQVCAKIINECTGCHRCTSQCRMLKQIGDEPIDIAERKPSIEEAYSCSLCGLCEVVCPASLSLKDLFAAARVNAVAGGRIDINEYRYMFPDRSCNVMSLYREINRIHYNDLCREQESSVAFFPGCTMLTYNPELTRTLFHCLKTEFKDITLITDCCGLPLFQLGVPERGSNYIRSVKTRLDMLKIKKLIIACPNCYYQLPLVLKDTHIKLMTVYEALNTLQLSMGGSKNDRKQTVAVHDSCPDRHDGIFAGQARKALLNKGFHLVEMEHHHQTAICCGSGGQATHFRPDLAEELVKDRLAEFNNSGAQILASYCLSCVLNFAKMPGERKIQHVLNLLLDLEQDFDGLKAKAKKMFEGPHGEENWGKIMAE